jgi:dolichol-phosphate mannosyltransferase
MIKLAADSVIGFSVKPLRTILTLALLSTLVFLVAFAYVLLTWASGKTLPGWTSILLVMLFGNMNLLIAIAAVGEYIGRIYFQLLARPSVLFHEK